jgi:CRISPR/Cas system-associated endonuclease/helicase Cas3
MEKTTVNEVEREFPDEQTTKENQKENNPCSIHTNNKYNDTKLINHCHYPIDLK